MRRRTLLVALLALSLPLAAVLVTALVSPALDDSGTPAAAARPGARRLAAELEATALRASETAARGEEAAVRAREAGERASDAMPRPPPSAADLEPSPPAPETSEAPEESPSADASAAASRLGLLRVRLDNQGDTMLYRLRIEDRHGVPLAFEAVQAGARSVVTRDFRLPVAGYSVVVEGPVTTGVVPVDLGSCLRHAAQAPFAFRYSLSGSSVHAELRAGDGTCL